MNKLQLEPPLAAHEMAIANWKNQTVWVGDNLPIMRGMNSESVDLIYLDPPFNSKTNYAAPIGSRAAGAAFKDTWGLTDVDHEWINLIEEKHPALYRVLLAAMTGSDKSYLVYMAARLLEMKRLLKSTGSIYLHCDPTMSHYLKLVMDAIWGRGNFLTEISWQRTSSHNDGKQGRRQYGRVRDVILFYRQGKEWTWNQQYTPYDQSYIDAFYKFVEPETGRKYRLGDLTGRGGAAKGNPEYEVMGVIRYWGWSRDRMQREIDKGRVIQTKPGNVPQYKRYLDEMPGKPLQDQWTDISIILGKQRTGYRTQKPLKLLRRIVLASSNPGDVVLDPFCGCATTCIAAELEGRLWTGIDLSPKAGELIYDRMKREVGLFYKGVVRTDIPLRSDLGSLPPYNCTANKKLLYGEQGGDCAGCRTHFELHHFDVDHIIARSKGGTDHLQNLQLLCGNCNDVKGNRGMEYLMHKLQIRRGRNG